MTAGFHGADVIEAAKCELAGEVLRAWGTLRLRVTGWSMLPAVWPGDTLVVESASIGEVREGDIVLCGRNRRVCAHRVVKKLDRSTFLTRGDAMRQPDPVVHSQELLGRVSHIVRDGKRAAVRRRRGIPERAIATIVRHSPTAARVLVGIRDRLRSS